MADEVVGRAFVEIKAKLDGLDRELNNNARSRFGRLERAAEAAGESIEGSMRESSRQSGNWLDRIGGADVWNRIKNEASRAGEAITGHFREAARQSERALDGVSASGGAGGRFLGMASAIGGALATIGVGRGLAEAIDQAADLGESVNAISVVLGDAAGSFLEFGEGAANGLGLTQSQLNTAVVPMAALLKNAGLAGDELSGQLAALAQAATDTGSVLNKDTGEVLDAFGAALRGEAEPARALGVSFNDAAVQAKAMELGLADANGEIDEAAKTQARLALVLEQTNQFAGDFANTADSLPNTLKRLRASAGEAAAELGNALLPAVADVAGGIVDLIQGLDLSSLGDALGEAIGPLFDALGPAVEGLLPIVIDVVGTLGELFGGLAPLVEPLVGVLGLVTTIVTSLVETGLSAFAPVIETIASAIGQLLPVLEGGFTTALEALTPVLETVADVIAGTIVDAMPMLIETFEELAPIASEIASIIGGGISEVLPVLADAFIEIVGAVRPLLPVFATLIRDGLKVLVPIITQLVEAAAPLVTQIFGALTPIIARLAPMLSGVLATVLPIIGESFLRILEAVEPLIPLLADTLMSVLDSLAPVLPTIAEALGSLAVSLADILVAVLPLLEPLLQLVALLTEEALAPAIAGIAEGIAWLGEKLAELVETVVSFVEDVIAWFQDLYDELVGNSIIPDLVRDIVEWFAKLPIEVLRIVGDLVLDLVAKLAELPGKAISAISSLAGDIAGVFGDVASEGLARVSGFIDDIVTFYKDLPGKIVNAMSTIGSKVKGVFDTAWTTVKTGVSNLIDNVMGFFTELPGKILGALTGIGSQIADGVYNAFKSSWNNIVDFLPTVSIPIPFADDPKIDVGSYLRLANGAILDQATFFLGGEAGREVVVPLERPRRALELADQSGLTDLILGARGQGGGGLVVQFNGGQVYQDATDADVVMQRVYSAGVLLGAA